MINHQENCFAIPVSPGKAFVLKHKYSSFTKPFLGMMLLEDSLVESWMKSSHTLEEWDSMFATVSYTNMDASEGKNQVAWLTTKDLEDKATSQANAFNFKTPKKTKNMTEKVLSNPLVKHEPFLCITDVVEFNEVLDPKVKSLFGHMDRKLSTLSNLFLELLEWKIKEAEFTLCLSVFVENSADFLKRSIEKKSEKYPSEFDALDLWTCNEIIANKFETREIGKGIVYFSGSVVVWRDYHAPIEMAVCCTYVP